MRILVQFPTYGRAAKFIDVLSKYVELCSDENEITFNINCDTSDSTMTSEYVKGRIIRLLLGHKPSTHGTIYYDENTEKISAINNHIPKDGWDVVVCASDDMVPQVENWDREISHAMMEYFPDLDGCVHFDDGNTNGELITFSILGKKLYDEFGYIYHPDYKSLYCDNEFTDEVRRMGREQYIDKVIVSHEHWSIEGSENHNEVDLAVQKTLHYSGRDAQVYEQRKALGFPKERITSD
jgi:hypothetical protein